MSTDALRLFFDLVPDIAKPLGGKLLFLIVSEESAQPPPTPLRAELARHLQANEGCILRSAVVHEGLGFRASVVRSFVTGISVLFRTSYPRSVFANVEDAVRWLNEDARADVAEAAFLEALQEVRSNGADVA